MALSSEANLSWGSDGSMLDWEASSELTCSPLTKTCTLGERPEFDGAGVAWKTTVAPADGVLDDVVAMLDGGVLAGVVAVLDGGVLDDVVAVLAGGVLASVVAVLDGCMLSGTSETVVAVTVLVIPGVVCKAGMETVTGAEAAVAAGLEVAEGIRAAALGISSLPIVRPVTGS